MKIKAIYDNGGKTLDRYTIVTNERRAIAKKKYLYDAISASENGAGFFMWGECMLGTHLGKKVTFDSLSMELQTRINNALND